ncbi:MAG: NAD-dependent epimerase/dehydratase family protein [Balneola sp.]|nr:MAG: NAD-dependent epimerase/dehydratase family protein [Balneola sp.]
MKIIITGATGMVGKGAMLECLESQEVEEVLVVSRRSVGVDHPKLKELLVEDFFNLTQIKEELTGYDACFFSLGVSSMGKTEEEYAKITYELTLNFANTLLPLNPSMTFIYVSGKGTDESEQGSMMWANVKGRTENELSRLGFKAFYRFRPGYIHPEKGIVSPIRTYRFFHALFKPIYPMLRKNTKSLTDTTRIGQAVIQLVKGGYEKEIIDPVDINSLAAR